MVQESGPGNTHDGATSVGLGHLDKVQLEPQSRHDTSRLVSARELRSRCNVSPPLCAISLRLLTVGPPQRHGLNPRRLCRTHSFVIRYQLRSRVDRTSSRSIQHGRLPFTNHQHQAEPRRFHVLAIGSSGRSEEGEIRISVKRKVLGTKRR